MAVMRGHAGKKAPSQNPVGFFKGEQRDGTHESPQKVGDKLSGGPQREKIMGRKNLSRQ
jgi:hypothetical protein